MAQAALTYESYDVGIICALAIEKAALKCMLDQEHPRLRNKNGDDNDYTLGKIGAHNVAVACLPAGVTGKVSAATVAKDMLRTFPIRVGLMIGIGGGIWSEETDIRLGDVIVSQPDGIHGGVVQWDFGKMEAGGKFRRTGMLDKPPRVLLNALQTLKINHEINGSKLDHYLAEMITKAPRMAEGYGHQGTESDQLYQSEYDHVNGGTCDQCDISKLVKRPERRDFEGTYEPKIHYGNIASGDEVMRDGNTRDRIAAEERILCFEMEAAGLMDSFPCVVVRGIADYADSHKNKKWQRYAAATAAAYAKELLGVINSQEVHELTPASK